VVAFVLMGQIPAPLCPLALNAQGNTQNPNSIDNFAIGQHTIRASYGGDASFLPSIARPISFRITKAATQTALSSTPTTAPKGTQVTVFAAITTNSFGNPPSGTVTFFAGNKPLGPPVAVFGHFDSTTGLAIAEANIITTQLNSTWAPIPSRRFTPAIRITTAPRHRGSASSSPRSSENSGHQKKGPVAITRPGFLICRL